MKIFFSHFALIYPTTSNEKICHKGKREIADAARNGGNFSDFIDAI